MVLQQLILGIQSEVKSLYYSLVQNPIKQPLVDRFGNQGPPGGRAREQTGHQDAVRDAIEVLSDANGQLSVSDGVRSICKDMSEHFRLPPELCKLGCEVLRRPLCAVVHAKLDRRDGRTVAPEKSFKILIGSELRNDAGGLGTSTGLLVGRKLLEKGMQAQEVHFPCCLDLPRRRKTSGSLDGLPKNSLFRKMQISSVRSQHLGE